MNIKEYIESGVLEAYILGSLSTEEETLVEANIAKFPELADELLAIENAMQEFSSTLAKDPPPGLENKIWEAIQHQTKTINIEVPHTVKTIPFQPEYRKQPQYKYAAVWVVLAGSLAVNAYLWSQDRSTKAQVAAINADMQTVKAENEGLAAQLGDYHKSKSMMADTATQTIVMHTMQKGHPMMATLYWSKDKGEAFVSVDGLPQPPKGMQYQLWVMQNGKPVDMGVLPNNMANTPAIQKINMSVTNGEAFAITLEQEGGKPTPTMENLYVMGKV